jgi:hypothetical protein
VLEYSGVWWWLPCVASALPRSLDP